MCHFLGLVVVPVPVAVLPPLPLTSASRVSPAGEDMAHEHVHAGAAAVHRGAVGGEVHRGLAGLPLRPHHDGAAAPPHPLQGLRGARAPGGRFGWQRYSRNVRTPII